MSDGWFDRSYRSDETPPADLDARILAAARRATRRWTLPAVAAGALTVAAVAILGFLITGHELYVSPVRAPLVDSATGRDGLRIDVVQPSGDPERSSPPTEFALPEKIRKPDEVPLPNPLEDDEESSELHRTSRELDCGRSALVGPLGGPERHDLIQICSGDVTLYIDVVWDGEPACPSRFEIDATRGASVGFDGRDLVIDQTRIRCERGQWIRRESKRLSE